MEPLRILMLFTILNRGGAESMVMNYFRHIDRSKVVFDFMVHRQERGAYDDEVEALGGKIYRMLPLHPPFIAYKKQISQFFDDHPEYKIIHGHCSESGYFVYKEASKRGIPIIIAHAHSAKAMFDHKWFFRSWFKHRMRPYLTHCFTCGSEAAEWLVGKDLAQRAIFQKNAIDTQKYRFDENIALEKRNELGISGDSIVIGHVGSFWKIKNQSFLIDIFNIFLKKHPLAYLLLVGEGELKGRMIEKANALGIQEHVKFLGSRADVPSLLMTMDIFVFPSYGEGFSLAMLEAQCAGLPILASDTIPHEIALTDLITFTSLSHGANKWSEVIDNLLSKKVERDGYPTIVQNLGYDIIQNAEWLQQWYLKQLREGESKCHS